jgi:23S rRNA (uracil1939-C5)-methyltransferase
VLTPELQSQLERLRREMNDGELLEDSRYFRVIAGDEEVSVASSHSSPTLRKGGEVRNVKRTIGTEAYLLNAESFFQTNIDLLPQLIDAALGDAHGKSAIELYCGVGLFTVPLARRFKQVIAIEDDADATKFARENLLHAGLRNTEVVNADVRELGENADALEAVDFLLLDPPRTGAESRVIFGILKLKPQRISYVSCDPATLARDLKKLIAGGYSIQSMRAFDMFPQTHHVETIVHLSFP